MPKEPDDEQRPDRISLSVTVKRGRATVHQITDFVTTPQVAGQMLDAIARDLNPPITSGFFPHPPGPGIRGVGPGIPREMLPDSIREDPAPAPSSRSGEQQD